MSLLMKSHSLFCSYFISWTESKGLVNVFLNKLIRLSEYLLLQNHILRSSFCTLRSFFSEHAILNYEDDELFLQNG